MRRTARATTLVAALVLVVFGLGVSGPASADPGHKSQARHGASAKSGHKTTARSTKPSARSARSSSGATAHGAATHQSSGTAGTTGDPTQPQPQSNADQNTGGANGQCAGGVYCSTRDGSPSLNGNGGGDATGKPCAGCVGRADNKNPQGQKPDAANDGNNGYECDGNNGIAKGNPAHTSCVPGEDIGGEECVPPMVEGPGGTCVPPETGCVPSATDDCVEGEDEVVPPTVLGEEGFRPRPRPNAQVLGVQAARPAVGVLPATGSSEGLALAAGGGFILLAGGAMLLMRRRATA
jgi:LPXTG-motif cell wall-anchored protein